jgi:Leucine-rich repeat (LRR) protein
LTDKAIQHLTNLEELIARDCSGLIDTAFDNMNKLKSLDVAWCKQLTSKAIQHLTNLEKLDAHGCHGLTDDALKNMHNLKKLDIGY